MHGTRVFASFLALMVLLWLGVAAASADEPRNPFTAPEKRTNPYQYRNAIKKVTVQGIIRTEIFHGCLIRVADMESLVVLEPDEVISLEYEGLQHKFSIQDIKEKSVVFVDTEGQIYEVPIR